MDRDKQLEDQLINSLTARSGDAKRLLEEKEARKLLTWARAAKKRRPVLFAGAGLSLNANPREGWREQGEVERSDRAPAAMTWSELSERLRRDLTSADQSQDPLWLAELYRQAHGNDALHSVVAESVPDRLLIPGAAHMTLAKIRWEALLTTNYDSLLERALEKAGRIPAPCSSDSDLVRSRERAKTEVIHLHGVLTAPESVVLALDDYRRYPAEHPGLLAKLRQLFLQHPVLLVGVSAVDPNFVQWSGWIRDVVGDHCNRMLSLDIGSRGESSTAFWGGLLTFVRVSPETLVPIARAVADYLNPPPLSRETLLDQAAEDRESANTAVTVVSHLETFLAYSGLIQVGSRARYVRELIIDALTKILQLSKIDPELVLADSSSVRDIEDDRPSRHGEDRGDLLKVALGEHWPTLLNAVWRYVPTIWRFGRGLARVDLLAEFEKLAGDPSTRRARVGLVDAWLQTVDFDSLDGSIGKFVPDAEESDGPHLQSVRRVHLLRESTSTPPAPGASEVDPQAERNRGFLALVAGERGAALAHYKTAAEKSSAISEPEHLELLTVESAIECSFGSEEGRSSLITRRETLRLRLGAEAKAFDGRLRRAVTATRIAVSDAALEGRAVVAAGDPGLIRQAGSAELLYELESNWVLPRVAGRLAEDLGLAHWLSGNVEESARTLTRYGSGLLGKLIADEMGRSSRFVDASRLAEELLQDGRWPPEWWSRQEALLSLLPELSSDQLDRTVAWLDRGAESKNVNTSVRLRGRSLAIGSYSWAAHSAELVIASLPFLSEEEASRLWTRWLEKWKAAGDGFERRVILRKVFAAVSALPLLRWERPALTLLLLRDTSSLVLPENSHTLDHNFISLLLDVSLVANGKLRSDVRRIASRYLDRLDMALAPDIYVRAELSFREEAGRERPSELAVELLKRARTEHGHAFLDAAITAAVESQEAATSGLFQAVLDAVRRSESGSGSGSLSSLFDSAARVLCLGGDEVACVEIQAWMRRRLTDRGLLAEFGVVVAALDDVTVGAVSRLLVGGQEATSAVRQQRAALRAVRNFVRRGDSAAAPTEWWVRLAGLGGQINKIVAIELLQALPALVRSLPEQAPQERACLAVALTRAATDPRAQVQGALRSAVADIDPELIPKYVADELAKVDPRVGATER